MSEKMPNRSRTPEVYVVLVTCPSVSVGRRLAGTLVRTRLAACVTIVPGVESLFWWKGRVDRSREALLLMKTTARRFEALRRAILARHPYEVPEVIGLAVAAGHAPYLEWVRDSVLAPGPARRASS